MKKREQLESKAQIPLTDDVIGKVTQELVNLIRQECPVRIRRPFPQTGSSESFKILKSTEFIQFSSKSGKFQARIFHTAEDIINHLNLDTEQIPTMLEDGLGLILQAGTAVVFDVERTGQELPFYPDHLTAAAIEYLSAHQPEQTPVKLLVTDWKKFDQSGRPNENYATFDYKIKQHGDEFSWLSPAQRQANAAFLTLTGQQAHHLGFTDAHVVTFKDDRIVAFFMKPQAQS